MGILTGSKTARTAEGAGAEPPGAAERRALTELLRIWAETGLQTGAWSRSSWGRWADGWRRALLTGGAAPVDPEAPPSPQLSTDFAGRPELAALLASVAHRRGQEVRSIASLMSGLAAAFMDMVLQSRDGFLEDARDDEEIARSVAHLQAAVESGDDQSLRLRAEQVLRVVHRKAESRRKRTEARMRALGEKLAEQRSALVDPETKSSTDPMTGLPSRHALETVLERERLIAQLSRVPASTAKLGLAPGQAAAGHEMMDRIMGLLAERVAPHVDERFFLGRFSGDQFLVVIPGLDEVRAAELTTAWVKAVVARPFDVGGRSWKAPFFAGVAEVLAEERRDEWVFRADEAMEAAQAQGQRRALRYSEL